MMRKEGRFIKVLLILGISVAIFFIQDAPVEASCMDNPKDDCYVGCPEGQTPDTGDCRVYIRHVINCADCSTDCSCYKNPATMLGSQCAAADGRYFCNRSEFAGQCYIDVDCYYPETQDNPWSDQGAIPENVCGCIDESSGGSEAVDELTDRLELRDLSIGGIFAGQLSVNNLVQVGILLLHGIVTAIILVIIIINGMKISGAGADEQKKQMAVKGLINAIIGFVVVVASYLILSIFFSFFGLSPFKDVLPIECAGLEGDELDQCLVGNED